MPADCTEQQQGELEWPYFSPRLTTWYCRASISSNEGMDGHLLAESPDYVY